MKTLKKPLSLLLVLALALGLTVPAAASEAMGEDLSAKDTLLHNRTQLSSNVFWSTAYSDLRTENLITYEPNKTVRPIVTAGDTMTDCTAVSTAAQALEAQGYRVVAGINGDFYNTSNGLPIGIVVTEGKLRTSDGGYYAVGFRSDGTALIGKPGVAAQVDLGYGVDDGYGNVTELIRPIAGINKARVSGGGMYLYTYDFNSRHTTGTVDAGVNVLCTITSGEVAIGSRVTAYVEQIQDGPGAVSLQPNQIALSVHGEANNYYVDALRNLQVGTEITVHISANEGWDEVEYAVGALYSLVENGTLKSDLPTGVNPRTAIGQKADGTIVFYTMDGRKSGYSVGSSLTQVGERLMELGCVNVLGLDGGGSTNLAVTTPDSTTATIYNRPSESNRKVTNQVFLVASNRPSGTLHHFYVSAANDYVLAGSSVQITATAVDSNYIPMNKTYTLSASAGSITDNVLKTPKVAGDITVKASSGSKSGQTTIHVVDTPDAITMKNGTASLSSLTVTPGAKLSLSGEAVWNHLPVKADPEAFTWSLSGNIGMIDEGGKFTASTPGEGTITVSAGRNSVTIPVTVTRIPLKTLDGFENGTGTVSYGMGIQSEWKTDAEYVRFGRGALGLTYSDLEYDGRASINAYYEIPEPYDAVNLWVYGDGSGNDLMMETDGASQQICTLDFTGWKQINVQMPENATYIEGFAVQGVMVDALNEETGEFTAILTTANSGKIYMDQMVAAFQGTMDQEVPEITAEADSEAAVVRAKISDRVDGVLPASSVVATYNGSTMATANYDAKNGQMTIYLPELGESHEAGRVTIIARDASGNIGRASVDIASVGVEHKFTDIQSNWAATYIDYLYNAGVTTGYTDGSFKPNQNITRAQFAVMLYRYLGLNESAYANVELPFADLNQIADYALPAVKALYTEGVINGTTKNGRLYFEPNMSLTRAQAATMIGRTQEKGYAVAQLTFTDTAKIPAYATYYIQTMVAQGIISGYTNGSFQPNSNITRGQMAKILYTLM